LKLSKITEIATAYHKSHSAIKVPANKGVRFNTLAVDEGETSRVANMGPPAHNRASTQMDHVALAEGTPLPIPPSTSGYTPSVEYSMRSYDDGAPPDPYNAINMVQNGRNPSLRNQFPPRSSSNADTRRRTNEFFPLVCFTCFKVGHRSTDCQHRLRVSNDAQFVKWQCDNFEQLEEWQRMWLKSINRNPVLPKEKPVGPATNPPTPLPANPVLMTQPKN